MTPAILQFRPLEESHAAEMLSWRYAPPYDIYNAAEPVTETAIHALLRPELHYLAVMDERDEMIAFRCFGPDAQVPGGDYSQEALDLGGGLRSDLTGKGLGRHVIAAAMSYAFEQFHPRLFRITVASFNQRAKKVCEQLGFKVITQFIRPSDGLSFQIIMQKARKPALSIPMKVTELNPALDLRDKTK
jgi:RimJ/RimL family protein N-acetyltransferase